MVWENEWSTKREKQEEERGEASARSGTKEETEEGKSKNEKD